TTLVCHFRHLVCLISLFSCSTTFLYFHSFPTRRSSDLSMLYCCTLWQDYHRLPEDLRDLATWLDTVKANSWFKHLRTRYNNSHRSEEHTSELQSRFDLVCRLLLEKKK